ncbi:MAG: helix-turn-helix transcriptional regulator [Blastocatellia bacterium]|nr:helix-turn-helix transcriptional regulator [Blastocatellia bacterium]
MGRPKSFELDDVLDRAIEAFWCKGYEATSIQDLVDEMGINRGSLYATFGDKHALFLAAIER